MRKYVVAVLAIVAVAVAIGVAFKYGPHRNQTSAQAGAPNYSTGIPADRQDRFFAYVYSTMNALMNRAPAFNHTALGHGTRAYSWRTTAVLGSIYMTADGTQFALEDVNSTGFNGSAGSAGTLDRGRFTPFNIPDNGEMNNVLEFVAGKGPVIRIAHNEDAPPRYYALSRRGAFPYSSSSPSLAHVGDISSGSMLAPTCADTRSTAATAFAVSATSINGVSVSREELKRATLGLAQYPSVGVACYRFAGQEFLSINFSNEVGMTFLYERGHLIPAIRSFPFLRTERYLVFHLSESGSDPVYQDYLEIATTK